jgi:hypothetical protein
MDSVDVSCCHIDGLLIRFDKGDLRSTKQHGGETQNAIASSQVKDVLSMNLVHLIDTKHPIRRQVTFCSVLFEFYGLTWMWLEFGQFNGQVLGPHAVHQRGGCC